MDLECTECGGEEWTLLNEKDYPERRRERDRTVEQVYRCNECGAQGKRFDQKNDGTVQLSGAMR